MLNGVVLVSYFNQLRAQGVPRRIVVDGSKRRLRPVLMTASITALGLVPLLFATGPGSEIQRPLAIVVIGGLLSSTALTLILLPILYVGLAASRGGRMSAEDVCLTLIAAQSLRAELFDYLTEQRDLLLAHCLPRQRDTVLMCNWKVRPSESKVMPTRYW